MSEKISTKKQTIKKKEYLLLFTNEMLDEIIEIFETLSDENSYIPHSKLPLALKSLGISMRDYDENIKSEILTSLEVIDIDRFIIIIISTCLKQHNYIINEIHETFQLFNKKKDGAIQLREIINTLEKVSFLIDNCGICL